MKTGLQVSGHPFLAMLDTIKNSDFIFKPWLIGWLIGYLQEGKADLSQRQVKWTLKNVSLDS